MNTDMPDIPGFNVPLALRQLGNNTKLYTKLLDQFQKSYRSAANDIAENVASGDFETAERSAHTIKGLAGSLGATALQEVSATLEKLCREQTAGESFTIALAAFGKEINAAIASICGYLDGACAPARADAPGMDAPQLAARLASLAAHIHDSDAKALMVFDEIRPQLAGRDDDATRRLAAAFEIFDFETAAEIVTSLRAKFG